MELASQMVTAFLKAVDAMVIPEVVNEDTIAELAAQYEVAYEALLAMDDVVENYMDYPGVAAAVDKIKLAENIIFGGVDVYGNTSANKTVYFKTVKVYNVNTYQEFTFDVGLSVPVGESSESYNSVSWTIPELSYFLSKDTSGTYNNYEYTMATSYNSNNLYGVYSSGFTAVGGTYRTPGSTAEVVMNNPQYKTITYYVTKFKAGNTGTGGNGNKDVSYGSGRYERYATVRYHSNYPDGTDYVMTQNVTLNMWSSNGPWNVFDFPFLTYGDCNFGGYTPKKSNSTWYKDAAANNEQRSTLVVNYNREVIDLYAGWKEAGSGEEKPQVTLTYIDRETEYSKLTTTKGNEVLVGGCDNTYENHEFLGWDTDPSAKNVVYEENDTFVINEDTTLYAVWKTTEPAKPEIELVSHPVELTKVFNGLTSVEQIPENFKITYTITNPIEGFEPITGTLAKADGTVSIQNGVPQILWKMNVRIPVYRKDGKVVGEQSPIRFVESNYEVDGYEHSVSGSSRKDSVTGECYLENKLSPGLSYKTELWFYNDYEVKKPDKPIEPEKKAEIADYANYNIYKEFRGLTIDKISDSFRIDYTLSNEAKTVNQQGILLTKEDESGNRLVKSFKIPVWKFTGNWTEAEKAKYFVTLTSVEYNTEVEGYTLTTDTTRIKTFELEYEEPEEDGWSTSGYAGTYTIINKYEVDVPDKPVDPEKKEGVYTVVRKTSEGTVLTSVTRAGIIGDIATATDEDKKYEGYTFDAENSGNVLSKEIAADGSTEIILIFNKDKTDPDPDKPDKPVNPTPTPTPGPGPVGPTPVPDNPKPVDPTPVTPGPIVIPDPERPMPIVPRPGIHDPEEKPAPEENNDPSIPIKGKPIHPKEDGDQPDEKIDKPINKPINNPKENKVPKTGEEQRNYLFGALVILLIAMVLLIKVLPRKKK